MNAINTLSDAESIFCSQCNASFGFLQKKYRMKCTTCEVQTQDHEVAVVYENKKMLVRISSYVWYKKQLQIGFPHVLLGKKGETGAGLYFLCRHLFPHHEIVQKQKTYDTSINNNDDNLHTIQLYADFLKTHWQKIFELDWKVYGKMREG